jgi:hypothetical protein
LREAALARASMQPGLPISGRRGDWFFVVAFSFFTVTSIITDSVNGLNGSLDPDSAYAIERWIYDTYARVADPLLIVNPPQVRVSAWISAFVWLPMYVLFIVGFIKGWNRIRPFGLVYGGALTHGMITYMADGIFGRVAAEGWADPALCPGCVEPNTLYYLAANLPYLVVPALMVIRMWRNDPFGVAEARSIPAPTGHVTIDLRGDEPVVRIGDQEVTPDVIIR